MRSIICISLIAASPALADPAVNLGCYKRDYTPEHLAANPGQVVDEIYLLNEYLPEFDQTVMRLSVLFAGQGHAGRDGYGGAVLRGVANCNPGSGGTTCAIECDGGALTVTRDDGVDLWFTTQYMLVGDMDGCGGLVDLAERSMQPTSYRLSRVPNAVCAGRF